MSVDRWYRSVAAGITVLAAVLLALDVHGWARTGVLVAFVLLCPGLAWARLLRFDDVADTIGIGVALSVVAATLVGQTMALASWWSPETGFAVLASLTAAGVLVVRPVEEPAADSPTDS